MALELDGVNQRITAPDSTSFDLVGDFTFSFWINIHAFPGSSFDGVFSHYASESIYTILYLDGRGGIDYRQLSFHAYGGVGNVNMVGAIKALSLNIWEYIVVLRTGDNWYLFINNNQDGTVSSGTAIHTLPGTFCMGYIGFAGDYFDGIIDDFRIYNNRALSGAERDSVYRGRGSDNVVNGLAFRWLINEKHSGSTATVASSIIDSSGNGNYGTPVNSPIYRASEMKLKRAPIMV